MHQRFFFLVTAHQTPALRDALYRGIRWCDLNALRVVQKALRQLADFAAEGGGEQQGLALLGQMHEDFANVVNEAHIEHTVRFI